MLLISTMLILVAPNCLASPDEPSSAEELPSAARRIQKGEYEKSIADLTEAINLDPDRNYYVMRGAFGNSRKSMIRRSPIATSPSKAIRETRPRMSFAAWRGPRRTKLKRQSTISTWPLNSIRKMPPRIRRGRMPAARNGDYRTARSGYEKALELDPADPDSWNDYAWFEATCPEAKYRNGKRAIERATKACEFTHFKQSPFLDTLAAANAELGDFASAVKWQTRARDAAPASERPDYQSRLDLYKAPQTMSERNQGLNGGGEAPVGPACRADTDV